MSWSIGAPPGPLRTVKERFQETKEQVGGTQFDLEEAEAAYQAALAAVPALAEAVGAGPDTDIAVTLSGHANEGHLAKPGWSQDSIYISVTRYSI